MPALKFTLSTGAEHRKTFEDDTDDLVHQQVLERFAKGHAPFSEEWMKVDDGWIRRDAIVSATIVSDSGVAFSFR